MAIGDQQVSSEIFEEDDSEGLKSIADEYDSDDSEEDPTFDILEETCSGLSKLSLKRSRSRASKTVDSARKLELDEEEIEVPELDEKDKKSFEKIQEIIKAGGLEKLTVDQCKVYLRKHGLRLTGKKDILIGRIREHNSIIDGGGEEKYPISSFVLNCKGDACTGDVVMFEQNVYEMYSIASRSATGPPIGTRMVAGRIVKESYGAAKQQHTFTIEVLWSKGSKPLPSLHPLLIKGRNLYRLKTMRQRWVDEEERNRVLQEKHSRGFVARSNRETRIQGKETRKRLNGQRNTRKENTFQSQNRLPQPNPKTGIPTPQLAKDSAAPANAVLTGICTNDNIPLEKKFIKSPNSKFLAQNSTIHGQRWGNIVHGENHQNTGALNRQPLTIFNHSPNRMHHDANEENEHYFSLNQHAHDKLAWQQIPKLSSPPRRPLTGGHSQQLCKNSSSPGHYVAANDNNHSFWLNQNANDKVDRQPLSRCTSPSRRQFPGGHIQQQVLNQHEYDKLERQQISKFPSPPRSLTEGHTRQLCEYSSSPVHHVASNDNGHSFLLNQNANDKLERQPFSRYTSLSRRPFSGGHIRQQVSNQHEYDKLERQQISKFSSPRRSGTGGHTRQLCEYSSSPMRRVASNDNEHSCLMNRNANDKLDRQPLSGFTSPSRRPFSGGHIREQVCNYYVQGRWCPYGDKCKYLHEYREKCVKQELCRYYSQGRCHYGGSCKFLHERHNV